MNTLQDLDFNPDYKEFITAGLTCSRKARAHCRAVLACTGGEGFVPTGMAFPT
jgi:hypothetical protein